MPIAGGTGRNNRALPKSFALGSNVIGNRLFARTHPSTQFFSGATEAEHGR